MEFAKAVDESTESPAVPEKIRQWVFKNLQGMLALSVKEETNTGRFKQLNKITLQNKQGELPDEDADEICEGIMRVIEKRDGAREEDDDPITFMLQAEVKTQSGKRHRPSMEYVFNPDGSPDDYGSAFGMDMDPRNQALELQNEYISRLHHHLDTAHGRITEIANNNNQALKPLMDALGWMGHFYAAGLQNQQSALALMYDVKKATIEERERTARQEKWMEFLKKPATALAGQFMGWATQKMGAKPPPGNAQDGARSTADAADVDVESNSSASGEGLNEDDLTDHQKENPVSAFAQAAGSCFTPNQWFELMEVLKKKEMRILRGVFDAESDADCVSAYDELSDLPAQKLMALNNILDDEQRAMLAQLGELVQAVKNKWNEDAQSEDDENESE